MSGYLSLIMRFKIVVSIFVYQITLSLISSGFSEDSDNALHMIFLKLKTTQGWFDTHILHIQTTWLGR